MVIDCAEIAKAKSDATLVSALADQTGQSIFGDDGKEADE